MQFSHGAFTLTTGYVVPIAEGIVPERHAGPLLRVGLPFEAYRVHATVPPPEEYLREGEGAFLFMVDVNEETLRDNHGAAFGQCW